MESNGYECLYSKKDPNKENGHGLLIAFKKERLQGLEFKKIYFDECRDFISPCKVSETGNIAQIVEFLDLKTQKRFILSNTHLYWRPTAHVIKIQQACTLIKALMIQKGDSKDTPMLLCGDWNTSPDCMLYSILTRKHSLSQARLQDVFQDSMDHHDSQHPYSYEKILEFISHPDFPELKSCYDPLPPFTTYTMEFKGTLDYIFTWGPVKVNSILQMPDQEVLNPAIPNADFPSDHLSLISKIQF